MRLWVWTCLHLLGVLSYRRWYQVSCGYLGVFVAAVANVNRRLNPLGIHASWRYSGAFATFILYVVDNSRKTLTTYGSGDTGGERKQVWWLRAAGPELTPFGTVLTQCRRTKLSYIADVSPPLEGFSWSSEFSVEIYHGNREIWIVTCLCRQINHSLLVSVPYLAKSTSHNQSICPLLQELSFTQRILSCLIIYELIWFYNFTALVLENRAEAFRQAATNGRCTWLIQSIYFLRGNVDLLDLLLVMQMASEICPPKRRTTQTTKDILVSRQLHSLYTALFPNRYEKHQEVGGVTSPNGYPPVSPTPLMKGNKIDSGCLMVRIQQCKFGSRSPPWWSLWISKWLCLILSARSSRQIWNSVDIKGDRMV